MHDKPHDVPSHGPQCLPGAGAPTPNSPKALLPATYQRWECLPWGKCLGTAAHKGRHFLFSTDSTKVQRRRAKEAERELVTP